MANRLGFRDEKSVGNSRKRLLEYIPRGRRAAIVSHYHRQRKVRVMPTTEETVGPYILGKCLGRGGFGAVFEARHEETGQKVALKILHNTKELEPEVQRRFVREVLLLKKLDDPNIVRIYEAGLHEGSIYCAMELVQCGTLKDVLTARYRLPWREAAEVTMQVSRALAHAHERGCVHRDLKPANLYLSEDGLVKLGDLGLARDLNDSRLTVAGQTVGTWRYMPPEQIRGEDEIDGRLDIYALGCITFEMIAGHVPFDGNSFPEIFDQHLESAPARLDVLVSNCPTALADLVDKMLEKKPEDRPANAGIVAETLEKLLSGEVSTSNNPQPVEADGMVTPAAVPNLTQRLHSGMTDTPQQAPNWKLLAIVGAVLAAVVGAIVAFK
jgi:serine/threonine protein kinase